MINPHQYNKDLIETITTRKEKIIMYYLTSLDFYVKINEELNSVEYVSSIKDATKYANTTAALIAAEYVNLNGFELQKE